MFEESKASAPSASDKERSEYKDYSGAESKVEDARQWIDESTEALKSAYDHAKSIILSNEIVSQAKNEVSRETVEKGLLQMLDVAIVGGSFGVADTQEWAVQSAKKHPRNTRKAAEKAIKDTNTWTSYFVQKGVGMLPVIGWPASLCLQLFWRLRYAALIAAMAGFDVNDEMTKKRIVSCLALGARGKTEKYTLNKMVHYVVRWLFKASMAGFAKKMLFKALPINLLVNAMTKQRDDAVIQAFVEFGMGTEAEEEKIVEREAEVRRLASEQGKSEVDVSAKSVEADKKTLGSAASYSTSILWRIAVWCWSLLLWAFSLVRAIFNRVLAGKRPDLQHLPAMRDFEPTEERILQQSASKDAMKYSGIHQRRTSATAE